MLFGILIGLLFTSCSKDDEKTPLVADFSTTLTGQAPNAQVVITNASTGETTYQWTFGTGASINTSTEKTPPTITVDKAGDFTITLKVSNGNEYKEVTKTISITGNSAIRTYTDVAFSQTSGSNTYGRFFSTTTGLIYKDNEVNATSGTSIDLAFVGSNSSAIYFASPNSTNLGITIPNATLTKIKNYQSGFSVSDFDSMSDDSKLQTLTVVDDGEVIGSLSFPLTVIFQNASGKKGVIKLKSINAERLLVDIKVQKY